MKFSKAKRRQKIHRGIRRKLVGTAERPRISVFRSNSYIYCQLIDDRSGQTLASASSKGNGFDAGEHNKTEQARLVGKALAEKARSINIEAVLFDRSGYLYHGRVKALADGAREGGLKF